MGEWVGERVGERVIDRATCEAVFREAVDACDPAARVREALAQRPVPGRVVGLAIGKAALAMARGAGPVARGLAITNATDGGPLPAGWTTVVSSHPHVTTASLEAGLRARALVESSSTDDTLLALVSGGASALVEQPVVPFDEYLERVRAAMASGMPIDELNRLRTSLSAIKGGGLAARSFAPVVTLVVSDVIGDDPRVVGSGPTVLDPPRDGDRVEVIAPIACFGEQVAAALARRGLSVTRLAEPMASDVASVADALAARAGGVTAGTALVAWGEPTVRVVDRAGRGGRAQQLALELARRLAGRALGVLVAGSDGIDGPGEHGAAGAFVDGGTWDAIARAGIDPVDALARCDAGTALDAAGALVVTGPTGINHADVVIAA